MSPPILPNLSLCVSVQRFRVSERAHRDPIEFTARHIAFGRNLCVSVQRFRVSERAHKATRLSR